MRNVCKVCHSQILNTETIPDLLVLYTWPFKIISMQAGYASKFRCVELSERLCLLYSVLLYFTVCSWNMLQVLVQTAVPVVQKLTKDSIGTRNKDSEEGTGNNTGPTTTVFVGNISEKASDMLVRQLLAVSYSTSFICAVILNLRHITCIELVHSRNKILSSFTHSYVIKHIKYGKRKFKLTCLTHENQWGLLLIDVLYVCALTKNVLIFFFRR